MNFFLLRFVAFSIKQDIEHCYSSKLKETEKLIGIQILLNIEGNWLLIVFLSFSNIENKI